MGAMALIFSWQVTLVLVAPISFEILFFSISLLLAMSLLQGSFYVYPTEEAGMEPKVSQGIPRNRPIKVLVRVYIVKVSLWWWWQ